MQYQERQSACEAEMEALKKQYEARLAAIEMERRRDEEM